jgi:hypothetical protein
MAMRCSRWRPEAARFGCRQLRKIMPACAWSLVIGLMASARAFVATSGDEIFVDSFETFSKIALPDILATQSDSAAWATLKANCDTNLNRVIGDGYAGFDWRAAAQNYGICYNVALLKRDPQAPLYSKKAVAILKTLARSFPVIAPNQNHQFLAFGDGTTKSFALPMPPLAGTTVRVFVNTASVKTFTYSGATQAGVTQEFDAGALYPVLKIADTNADVTANTPAQYAQETDYHISTRDIVSGNNQYNVLHWLGANHPAATYFVASNANANNTEVAASAFALAGTNLVFTTAPAAGQTIFVQYLGSDYTQTSNAMGRVESVKPDGPGYNMRAMNVGLAYGYDAMRQSPDLTPALRQEMYTVLNGQIDWYTQAGYEGPHDYPNPIGNYYIRGYLTGVIFTAYATDSDNPRARAGGDLKPLASNLLMQTFTTMQNFLPGGYGPQGTYSEGTNQDMLQPFDVWKRVTATDGATQDLAPQLEWDANLVPATIHGTKPDRSTFYDGGDWNDMPPHPATPLIASMRAFVKYQPSHAMAAYARQLLADVGAPVDGPKADYKSGPGVFPLSYKAKFTGPVYARSDWGTDAVWVSFAAGPIFEDHQHRDQGHFTIQKGADYLVINAGGYGIDDTVPWHNTLGFDDRGAGGLIVYPPGQGNWGSEVRTGKYVDGGTFVYAQSDIADAYVNNDGVRNSVTQAVRTFVYVRPDIVVVHDRTLTANANVKKYFSINFGGSFAQAGSVYSAVVGQSKVFMQPLLPANPVPTILPPGTNVADHSGSMIPISGTNYQIMTTGQVANNFLHVFRVTAATATSAPTASRIQSVDGLEEGAEVDGTARQWIVMSSTSQTQVPSTSTITYNVLRACPCTHIVGDLSAAAPHTINIAGGAGGTLQLSTDANGVLVFQTNDPATTGVQIQ